jgi:hypothetical protein
LVALRGLIALRVAVAGVTVGLPVLGFWPRAAAARGPGACGAGSTGGRLPRGALGLPLGVVGACPAAAALTRSVRRFLAVVTASEPHAQKDGNENHDDNGREADYQEQDHYTTQRSMAIWVALARRTRPSTQAFPQYR